MSMFMREYSTMIFIPEVKYLEGATKNPAYQGPHCISGGPRPTSRYCVYFAFLRSIHSNFPHIRGIPFHVKLENLRGRFLPTQPNNVDIVIDTEWVKRQVEEAAQFFDPDLVRGAHDS